jgi:hypothetical protein
MDYSLLIENMRMTGSLTDLSDPPHHPIELKNGQRTERRALNKMCLR